jgi:O-antigen ligase
MQQESTLSRKILWQAGIAIAMDNPVFGIGASQFTAVSPQYANRIDPSLLKWEEKTYFNYRTLGTEAIHNDFLDIWVSYGTIALIVYLWIIFAILRNFIYSYRTSNSHFVIGISLGLAAGLIAYLVNSFYHNCLQTFPFFWILAAFSMATAKLAVRRKTDTQISLPPTGASS